ncbi:DEAD/DEAH box helicase [Sorangium sp. So ce1099]|uniref:DEAD/DEAH box helicase n=1 Tax=Sorangium sp. So ce1099 TaxID=3133331 RepID=UPI003F645600
MNPDSMLDALPAPLAGALARRGFTSLTPVQQAVLAPDLAGRDLRVSSQTGSGKTVAIGLALAPRLERALAERAPAAAPDGASRTTAAPAAVIIAPTRELAAQIAAELSWLLSALGAQVACVTGGTSFGAEARSLRRDPLVIAGTPGRLLDHLERGTIDPRGVLALVLDEADQMLDLGFREELEAIAGRMPEDRQTHLVSATFSREVRALADRFQRDAVSVAGTRPGAANVDIAHVAHLVLPAERDAAIVNLLLLAPGERTLVFVRTREGAAELADKLSALGLPAGALSGDLEQRERTRTLDAFRSGAITTLVATDVAARGIDVPEVGRVIHADPPGDPEIFTHRSGRTGRAGRKGTSVLLVAPFAREHALRLLRRARVEATFRPVPSPDDVLRAADERLAAELAAARRHDAGAAGGASAVGEGAAGGASAAGDGAVGAASAASAVGEGAVGAASAVGDGAVDGSTAIGAGPAGAVAVGDGAAGDGGAGGDAGAGRAREASGPAPDPRLKALAARLLADMDATELVAALLARAKHTGPCAPQPVTAVAPPRSEPSRDRSAVHRGDVVLHRGDTARRGGGGYRGDAVPRGDAHRGGAGYRGDAHHGGAAHRGDPAHHGGAAHRGDAAHRGGAPQWGETAHRSEPAHRGGDPARHGAAEHAPRLPFVPFQVNWGERHGADPRRLLALVCRRGGVSSRQIGAIRIGSTASVVEVASPAAPDFARAVNQPDARDARIRIVRASSMRVD